MKMPQYR